MSAILWRGRACDDQSAAPNAVRWVLFELSQRALGRHACCAGSCSGEELHWSPLARAAVLFVASVEIAAPADVSLEIGGKRIEKRQRLAVAPLLEPGDGVLLQIVHERHFGSPSCRRC